MKTEYKILDHGYLKFIEHWGSDERIIEAARMSTDKGFLGWEQIRSCKICHSEWIKLPPMEQFQTSDQGCPKCSSAVLFPEFTIVDKKSDFNLLQYLYQNAHSTPFEMAGIVIEVKAPIMVFREWHRHRTQSFNEMSARYVPLPDENYIPDLKGVVERANTKTKNKQAQGVNEKIVHEIDAGLWLNQLNYIYQQAEKIYQDGLKLGIPKELARLALPVGRYSKMRACANLRNWLAFLTLRMDYNAQWEIRQYANAIFQILNSIYPYTSQLFIEGFNGKQL